MAFGCPNQEYYPVTYYIEKDQKDIGTYKYIDKIICIILSKWLNKFLVSLGLS